MSQAEGFLWVMILRTIVLLTFLTTIIIWWNGRLRRSY